LKSGSLARRYAKALIAIGTDNKTSEDLGKELDNIGKLFASHDGLIAALQNPSYELERRRAVMLDLCKRLKPSETIKNFLLLVLDRGRVWLIPEVAQAYQALLDEHIGRARAEIVAAREFDLQGIDELTKVLEERTGKKIVVNTRIDPDLIAGKVTRIGSTVVDGSVRTRLEQLGTALLSGKV
jgi:F-type H+-transporting ATPase subunit delta